MRHGWYLDSPVGERVADGAGPVVGFPVEHRTNNVAELSAMLDGLELVAGLSERIESLTVVGDSQLALNIVSGKWKCKAPHLKPIREACWSVMRDIDGYIDFVWVPRDKNAVADAMAG